MRLFVKTQVVTLAPLARFKKKPAFLKKTFTKKELKYALTKRFPGQSLGARLAAKKALFGALGKKLSRSLKMSDVEISNDLYGRPRFHMQGRNRDFFKRHGIKNIAVSLSHAEHFAVASVMVEFRGKK